MYWLKQCTKCGGDLASDRDHYGPYISCMQCGQYQDIEINEAGVPAFGLGSAQPSATAVLSREGYRRNAPPRLGRSKLAVVA